MVLLDSDGRFPPNSRQVKILEEFRHVLHDALVHLHDPDFEPAEQIYTALGCESTSVGSDTIAAAQLALARLVESLQPRSDGSQATRTTGLGWSEIQVLQHRFLDNQTQEEAARALNMSVRTLQRVQRRAVYLLARDLWERLGDGYTDSTGAASAIDEAVAPEQLLSSESVPHEATPRPVEWRSQVQQELESLQHVSPHAAADLKIAFARVQKVGQSVVEQRGMNIRFSAIEEVPPGLIAAIHPSALRQVLIAAIDQIVRLYAMNPTPGASRGTITMQAQAGEADGEEKVYITMTGASISPEIPSPLQSPPHGELMREILASHHGTINASQSGNTLTFHIGLPAVQQKFVVLVVDDNADLVAFYRRFVGGTHYQIVHLRDGSSIFSAIEEIRPAVILLDVLLPEMDGWELLTYLHEHPETRAIPIIVSSVVRGEELAQALGATAYLPKPVRRRQLIQTLDQVLALAPA